MLLLAQMAPRRGAGCGLPPLDPCGQKASELIMKTAPCRHGPMQAADTATRFATSSTTCTTARAGSLTRQPPSMMTLTTPRGRHRRRLSLHPLPGIVGRTDRGRRCSLCRPCTTHAPRRLCRPRKRQLRCHHPHLAVLAACCCVKRSPPATAAAVEITSEAGHPAGAASSLIIKKTRVFRDTDAGGNGVQNGGGTLAHTWRWTRPACGALTQQAHKGSHCRARSIVIASGVRGSWRAREACSCRRLAPLGRPARRHARVQDGGAKAAP